MSFLESYDFLLTIRHLNLGEIDIWKQKDNEQLAFGKILQQEITKEELHERSNWEHENVIELLAAELHKQNGTSYISVYYEYFDSSLQDYLINQKLPLPESEVWNLLYQMIQGIMFMNNKGRTPSLTTTNIFYCNGSVKVIEGQVFNLQQQLGLVLFEICTRESQYLILESDNSVNQLALQQIIQELKYSKQLLQILNDLLTKPDKDQISILNNQLQPFKDQILQLKLFQFSKISTSTLKERATKAINNYKELMKKINQIQNI